MKHTMTMQNRSEVFFFSTPSLPMNPLSNFLMKYLITHVKIVSGSRIFQLRTFSWVSRFLATFFPVLVTNTRCRCHRFRGNSPVVHVITFSTNCCLPASAYWYIVVEKPQIGCWGSFLYNQKWCIFWPLLFIFSANILTTLLGMSLKNLLVFFPMFTFTFASTELY